MAYVANLPRYIEVVEGETVTLDLNFMGLYNHRYSYLYTSSTDGGSASWQDLPDHFGSSSMMLVSSRPVNETYQMTISTFSDDLQEGTEVAYLDVLVGGDVYFASGSFTQRVEIHILDNNKTVGGAGNDVLRGTSKAEEMRGDAGNDRYYVTLGDRVIEAAGAGIDTVFSAFTRGLELNVENLTLTGSAHINGNGNALNNTLLGNAGNNILNGGLGADTMKGGAGNDTYIVDNIGDVVAETANAGTDSVHASISYSLTAHVENLVLSGAGHINGTGNALANTLLGNAGNNILNGGAGADILKGGAGNDTYIVDNIGDRVIEAAGGGIDRVQASVSFTLAAEVENLTLTGNGHINGTGNALANIIEGNAGNNVLNGGAGADALKGGAGNDTYIVDHAGDRVFEVAGGGIDRVQASVSYALAAEVEHLTLTGTAHLNGTGNALANQMLGNAGNNVLNSGLGADTLNGGAGNDVLWGGAGADHLTGGAGADLFVFKALSDSAVPVAARDLIADFSRTQGDRIDLRGIDAHEGLGGDQAFRFVGSAAFSASAGELRIDRYAAQTVVSGDVNGDGRADFAINLTGNHALIASDFLL